MSIFLMRFLPWYLDTMNSSGLPVCQIFLVLLLLNYINVAVCCILKGSFLAFLTCRSIFSVLHHLKIKNKLNTKAISIICLSETCSFSLLAPWSQMINIATETECVLGVEKLKTETLLRIKNKQ